MKKCVVVGCGDRANAYCDVGFREKLFEVVACVDTDDYALERMQKKYGVKEIECYHNIDDVLKQGKIADFVINGTMDKLHIATSIPFLKQGYDMLLEKPITNDEKELRLLLNVVKENNNKLLVCHVLRYAEHYKKIKELIVNGAIGKVVNLITTERVGIAHSSASFIRGRWKNEEECGSTMLLQKCCHDLDLVCWLNNDTVPESVSSFGGRNFITPENAPKGAGTRCLVDCPLVDECKYSAKKICIDEFGQYVWAKDATGLDKTWEDFSYEEKIESLKTVNPHGLCAYKTNANVVDHQTVSIRFKNGSTATHSMLTSTMKRGRTIYILGTDGEIENALDDGRITLRTFDETQKGKYKELVFEFNNKDGDAATGGHYGGDYNLVKDFVAYIGGDAPSLSVSGIEDSIYGHLCVYAADKSRMENKTVEIEI